MINWPHDTRILIPSYRSAAQLKRFVAALLTVVPKDHILVVDDASKDGTYEFCQQEGINCIRHSVNKGKGAALKTGFAYFAGDAGVRWILTMDADGQHSPSDIPLFIDTARKYPSTGLCIGARDMRLGAMPPARILSNRLTSLILALLSGRRIKDAQCGYRIYSRRLVSSIVLRYNRFEMESEIILMAAAKKFSIRFVRVQTLYLSDGPSHISHLADTLRWVVAVLRVWWDVRLLKTRLNI